MQIETEVDESFIGMVKVGNPVSFTVFAYPDRTFSGTLAQVRLEPKIDAGVVKYNCIVHLDNGDLSLKPGMTATVAIEVERHNDVLKVPNAALRFVPPLSAAETARLRADLAPGEAIVWTPGSNGLEPRRVKSGLVAEKETEIEGEGLTPGMQVAVPLRKEDESRRRPAFSLF